jgi:Zn-dependent M28 family amino/carboxypeptidase
MQFAICRQAAAAASSMHALQQSALQWVKFGNEYFCYPADPTKAVDWGKVKASGISVTPRTIDLQQFGRSALYLVTQEGRTFQRAYPNAPVLFDKGRYLVVSLERQRVDMIVEHDAHFSMRPIAGNEVIFETLPRPTVPPNIDKRIKAVVDAISQASFKRTLTSLVNFPTRHSLSLHYRQAAKLAGDQLSQMGFQVSLQKVDMPGGTTLNVIADKRGAGPETRSLTLVTAHLDSINKPHHDQPEDPAAPAPGADDNGSGSAGLIEIARALKDLPILQDLRLILFGGEEQNLYGSKYYIAQLAGAERARISSVINMDMIAVLKTDVPTVLLEGGKAVSEETIAGLASAAHAYTRLVVNISLEPHDSDHVSFIRVGVPAVLTIEGNDDANTDIHSANDTLQHINIDLAVEILRMNAAFVAGEIGVCDGQ